MVERQRPKFEGLWRQKKANGKGFRYLLKGKDSEGKMVFVTVPIDDLRDTDAEFIHKCEEAKRELEAKIHPEKEQKDLAYWIDRYIELRHLRPGSQYQYRHHLKGYDLDDANNKRQLEILLKSDKSSSSIKQICGIVNTFFKYLCGEGVLSTAGTVIKNPASGVREGKFNHRTRVPTDEETQLILDWAKDPEDELFVRLLIATGARCSTLEIVKVGDLDDSNRIHLINVKCAKSYDFPILITDPRLIDLWHELAEKRRKKEDPLFTNGVATGRRVKWACYKYIKPDAHGERISPHSFRHLFATKAVQKGVPLEIVSKLLDHSSVSTTMSYYARHSQNQLDAAVETIAARDTTQTHQTLPERTLPHM